MRRPIGTDDVIGATLTQVSWSRELQFEKEGRILILELEEEWYDTCFCEGDCSCPPTYVMRAYEEETE